MNESRPQGTGMTIANGPLPLTRYRILAPSGATARASSTSSAHTISARVRDPARSGGRAGTRVRERGRRRPLVLRREEKVSDHGRERVYEPAGEPLLLEHRDVGLLNAAADIHREIASLERGEQLGVGSRLRPEAAQVHHAGRRETNAPKRAQDLVEVRAGLPRIRPHDLAVPIDAGHQGG